MIDLTSFDNNLKVEQEKKLENKKEIMVKTLKENGLNDYQVERKLEEEFMKPDKLIRFDPVQTTHSNEVKFFFDKDELELFKKYFLVLEYKGSNTHDNYLLFGLLQLIEEGKINYSKDSGGVWIV